MPLQIKNICNQCIGDAFLADYVRKEGSRLRCSVCGSRRNGILIGELAKKFDKILHDRFRRSSWDYPDVYYNENVIGRQSRHGDEAWKILREIADISDEAAQAAINLLAAGHALADRERIEENPYEEGQWVGVGPSDLYQRQWEEFCFHIRHRSRFFSAYAESFLAEMFAGTWLQPGWLKDGPAIWLDPAKDDDILYRARVAQGPSDLAEILAHPALRLGPPPAGRATAGRMNCAGISVFYGALEVGTCIAEVRPPVGSFVVVGAFRPVRRLRLLDLSRLRISMVEASHFDPNYDRIIAHGSFLTSFGFKISQPVMPNDEVTGYLPTQAIAEFLSEKSDPRLAGCGNSG